MRSSSRLFRYRSIFLNDNLALLVAARRLARRSARSNRHSELGRFLGDLAAEIDSDVTALREAMRHLQVPESRMKVPAVKVAELFGRLKPNGNVLRYSPLSRLLELEGLCLLVASKQRFWRSVAGAGVALPDGVDPAALAGRSGGQLARLEDLRHDAARSALGVAVPVNREHEHTPPAD